MVIVQVIAGSHVHSRSGCAAAVGEVESCGSCGSHAELCDPSQQVRIIPWMGIGSQNSGVCLVMLGIAAVHMRHSQPSVWAVVTGARMVAHVLLLYSRADVATLYLACLLQVWFESSCSLYPNLFALMLGLLHVRVGQHLTRIGQSEVGVVYVLMSLISLVEGWWGILSRSDGSAVEEGRIGP